MSSEPRTSVREVDARHYLAGEILKDGTAIAIRAIRPDDSGRLLEAFAHLDRQSIYTRFFSHKAGLTDAELKQYTDVDFDRVVALVATLGTGDGQTLIAGGRYVCDDAQPAARSAEIAFTTEEDYQGRGLASLLLDHLVRIARQKGVSRFEAYVLAENQAMLAVFRRSGLPMHVRHESGVAHVTLVLEAAGS
jgi:RimJ/RimL family protein N-acetyltransferase